MPIHVLSPAVSAKIAAGEVIERPGSAVKELVENALDADARNVAIEILGGGSRLIRVRDDGCGLTPQDASLAFHRHATSKLAQAEDLLHIATLGFRGEALPSIAAVAEVTLLTRPAQAVAGHFLRFRSNRLAEEASRGAPAGTVVMVRDLFSAYPARRKFLRSSATEASHCATVVSHYALARPDVRFSLISDGKRVCLTTGSGSAREAAAAVLGVAIAEALLEIAGPEAAQGEPTGEEGTLQVSGLVSPPGVTRAGRGAISLFVNGRWIQNRALTFAVQEAYQGSLMVGRHPVAVVYLRLPPEEVDVNVHPRKLEVRFHREGEVFAGVQRAIRRTLLSSAPEAGFHSSIAGPSIAGHRRSATPASGQLVAFQRELAPAIPPSAGAEDLASKESSSPGRRMPLLRVLGQVNNTYIIAEGPDGMYLVDQHAAHERVVFEGVVQRLELQRWEQQGLLDPKLVEVAAEEVPLLLGGQELLERYGFNVEPFGERQVIVRALPSGVREDELHQVLAEVLAGLRVGEGPQERLAACIACHSAIRAGDTLTFEEMRTLIRDLEECHAPQTCPHGRPTMMHLSVAQLEREFGRRG